MTMDCQYKLCYYNGRGLGEPIRMIFAFAEVPFEDYRPSYPDMPLALPPEVKEGYEWGTIPVLEFDNGKKISQSMAITRFLARKFGLVGANEYEAAKCDEYVDAFGDLLPLFFEGYKEQDESKRTELILNLKKTTCVKYLGKFNSLVQNNGGQRLVGNDLTWADIFVVCLLNTYELLFGIELISDYPYLKSLTDSVFSHPNIAKWLKSRPVTKY